MGTPKRPVWGGQSNCPIAGTTTFDWLMSADGCSGFLPMPQFD
jgi:hypothetical protein